MLFQESVLSQEDQVTLLQTHALLEAADKVSYVSQNRKDRA